MADKDKTKKPAEKLHDDSPEQNKHGVLTTQDTPKASDEVRKSATDPGSKKK